VLSNSSCIGKAVPFEGEEIYMAKELQGVRVIEVGAAVAVPIVGMLMGSWGADVIHVEPPGKGDNWRYALCLQASPRILKRFSTWEIRLTRSAVQNFLNFWDDGCVCPQPASACGFEA
jgi:hypothetical protein